MEIKILNIKDSEEANIAYWKQIAPEVRMEMIQVLREQYIKLYHKQELYNESRKGLRRVYRIVKLS